MKTYINNYGLLAFTVEGKDYISNKGEELTLPESNEYVQNILAKGYIVEKVTTSKTRNNA